MNIKYTSAASGVTIISNHDIRHHPMCVLQFCKWHGCLFAHHLCNHHISTYLATISTCDVWWCHQEWRESLTYFPHLVVWHLGIQNIWIIKLPYSLSVRSHPSPGSDGACDHHHDVIAWSSCLEVQGFLPYMRKLASCADGRLPSVATEQGCVL